MKSFRPLLFVVPILAIAALVASTAYAAVFVLPTPTGFGRWTTLNISSFRIVTAAVLTVLIEVPISAVLGLRHKKDLLAVICVNLITNPPLNLFLRTYFYAVGASLSLPFIVIAEVSIVVIEALLLNIVLKKGFVQLLGVTLVMNIISFFSGIFLYWMILR